MLAVTASFTIGTVDDALSFYLNYLPDGNIFFKTDFSFPGLHQTCWRGMGQLIIQSIFID
jgi:hypothetical protein